MTTTSSTESMNSIGICSIVYLSHFSFTEFMAFLAWQLRDKINIFISEFWWIIAGIFILCFIWTNIELQRFGHPINFNNAPYYRPSMTFYCLAAIALISSFCLYQVRKNKLTSLKGISLFSYLCLSCISF